MSYADIPPPAHHTADIVPHTVRALLSLAQDRGAAPEHLCRGLGFAPKDLADQDLRLSHSQVRELIVRAQRQLRDPALGLASGARQRPVSWGLPGLAMYTCETFDEVVAYGIEHQSAAGAMLHNHFEVNGREWHIEVTPRLFDLEIEAFLVEENFGSTLAVARCLVGNEMAPLRVDFAFPRPDSEEPYRRLFRCPVRFEAGSNRMTFETHWLSARLPGYDRVTCPLLRAQINTLLHRPAGRHRVVESVLNHMRSGIDAPVAQGSLAQQIHVSDRTLRRRLHAQDTSFRVLRDDIRYERARDLLRHSELTVAEVADAVGYSDARAFRRAFKRWSGQLPAEFRAAQATPPDPSAVSTP